jgi:membrane protease YdiL (CAAX protease family)
MDAAAMVFIVFAYALAIALSFVIWLTGGHESPLLFLSLISMFIPAAAVVAARFLTGEKLHADWHLPPKRYFPLALFLMPATMHTVMLSATVILTGEVPWQGWLTDHANGVFHSPAQLGRGTLNSRELAFHLITNAIFGLLLVSFLAFFEEIGWRVWLLQRLAGSVGQRKAITAVAIIWALWHVPFVLSGILYFANVSRGAATAIMPVGDFGAGLVIGWFWIRTRSIWIVSLAHGALNDWGQYAFKFMKDVPVSVFGTVYRSYDMIALASGSVALVVLGGLLVFSCIPDVRTSERISNSLTDIQ